MKTQSEWSCDFTKIERWQLGTCRNTQCMVYLPTCWFIFMQKCRSEYTSPMDLFVSGPFSLQTHRVKNPKVCKNTLQLARFSKVKKRPVQHKLVLQSYGSIPTTDMKNHWWDPVRTGARCWTVFFLTPGLKPRIHISGQMVHNISPSPRFPWNKRSHFPSSGTFWGENSCEVTIIWPDPWEWEKIDLIK